jgi:hypothetical protein
MEVGDGDLMHHVVIFDPDDINGGINELTARWIASGDVAHPAIIEAHRRVVEAVNRHEWDVLDSRSAGATYVNHRQLAIAGVDTFADHVSSMRMMGPLVPDFWIELAEVLAHSAMGLLAQTVLKGTSTDGVAIEIPVYSITLLDGDRVTRFEAFDSDQREAALARFEQLRRSGRSGI